MNIVSFLKRTTRNLLPQHLLLMLTCTRQNRYISSLHRKAGRLRVAQNVYRQPNGTVTAGPFSGLRLPPGTASHAIAPHLLGTYEMELYPVFERLFQQHFSLILNIGASIGFLALGFAVRFPQTPVIAFEPDPFLRSLIREGIQLNRLGHVSVKSMCTPQLLSELIEPDTLILCDCEGYEKELFTVEFRTKYALAHFVIEMHEGKREGLPEHLRNVFVDSHHLSWIKSSHRIPQNLSLKVDLRPEEAGIAVDEARTDGFSWLHAEPKSTLCRQP